MAETDNPLDNPPPGTPTKGDGPEEEAGDGNWIGSWFKAAKDKSTEVLGYIKQDVGEFSRTVTQEASSVMSSATTALKDKLTLDEQSASAVKNVASSISGSVSGSVSGFISQMSSVFYIPPDDEDEEAYVIQAKPDQPEQPPPDPLSEDRATFLDEIDDPRYEQWLRTVDLETIQDQLSTLLAADVALRQNYTSLVPTRVSHMLFWHRYFFRLHLREVESPAEEEVKAEVKAEVKTKPEEKAGDIHWDDEKFGGNLDIPEEEQARLLAAYEKECAENESTAKKDASLEEELRVADGKRSEQGSQKSTSSGVGSNDDEWVKEFEVDTEKSKSEEDDWEKCGAE